MKKISRIRLFLFALLFFLPLRINATSYISDYIDIDESVSAKTNEIFISLENGTNISKDYALIGKIVPINVDTYYYHYIIYYYDNSMEEVKVVDGYDKALYHEIYPDNGRVTDYFNFHSIIDSDVISNIKYYKIFIEPSTEEMVNNYIKYGIKNNTNGIDDIKDFDTQTLSFSSKIDFNPNDFDYYLSNYDVNIVVNENNSFDIEEKIGAYFNVSKHGIYRKIPLKNNITRLDGTTSSNKAKISNIKVDNDYSTSLENNYKIIKIGSSSETITGEKNYKISYTYKLGKDTGVGYDELYFNIIGAEWDTYIRDISFSISMPKEFDTSKIGFSSGSVGTIGSDNVSYEVDGNIIKGSYNGFLSPNEALTIRVELPEGYFIYNEFNYDYLLIIIPSIFLLISFILWIKFGKDDKVIETVEFYPPEGFNSAEIGFLYRGKTEDKDIVSLLIYLANKGYIKIVEVKDKVLFSTKNSFKIVRLKDYDGDNLNERLFLERLFSSKRSIKVSNMDLEEVDENDLRNSFYTTINEIKNNIDNNDNRKVLFEGNSFSKIISIIIMMIVTLLLVLILPVHLYSTDSQMLGILIFPFIGFSFSIAFWFIDLGGIFSKIFGLIWGMVFGGVPWLILIVPIVIERYILIPYILFAFVSIFVMGYLAKYMKKRTKYGNEILGKIKGFKRFIETCEKDKLEAMVMDNPTYFYDILPYAYVLDISDKWIEKFETIAVQLPTWYDGNSNFDSNSFKSFMNTTMTSSLSAMSSNYSSSSSSSSSGSSSSSSGGGSSGGGSGGGGGGSW